MSGLNVFLLMVFRLTFSYQSCAIASRLEGMLLPSFSISPDKGNGLLLWVEAIGVANATTHCVCVRLQDWSWCQW